MKLRVFFQFWGRNKHLKSKAGSKAQLSLWSSKSLQIRNFMVSAGDRKHLIEFVVSVEIDTIWFIVLPSIRPPNSHQLLTNLVYIWNLIWLIHNIENMIFKLINWIT